MDGIFFVYFTVSIVLYLVLCTNFSFSRLVFARCPRSFMERKLILLRRQIVVQLIATNLEQ